jgi:hypothetical protein
MLSSSDSFADEKNTTTNLDGPMTCGYGIDATDAVRKSKRVKRSSEPERMPARHDFRALTTQSTPPPSMHFEWPRTDGHAFWNLEPVPEDRSPGVRESGQGREESLVGSRRRAYSAPGVGVLDDHFWPYDIPSWHCRRPALDAIQGGKFETTFYFTSAQLSK